MVMRSLIGISLAVSMVLAPGVGRRSLAQTHNSQETRFDSLVRADFFAGLSGDQAAFARAMQLIEETLAKNPQHAEARVWLGSGLLHQGGQAFQNGDSVAGARLWNRGLKEMDDAAAVDPQNVGVLIPRGATLLQASRQVPLPAEARRLLALGVADYEKVLTLQAPYFATLSVHAKGELLFGLAEGLHRLGEIERARRYFQRLRQETKGSPYESRAAKWIDTTPSAAATAPSGCSGCHAK